MSLVMNKGTTDQILFGTVAAFSAPAAVTWMFWFQREAINMTNDGYVVQNDGSQLFFPHITANNVNAGVAGVWFAGTGASYTIPATTWVHITGVYTSGPTLTFYADGVAQTTAAPGTFSATATNLKIQDSAASTTHWENWRAWSVALTPEEIRREAYSYTPIKWDSALVMWNPLDDGTTCADYSGNGVTGTITGSGVGSVGRPPYQMDAERLISIPRLVGYRTPKGRRQAFRRGSTGLIPYYQSGV